MPRIPRRRMSRAEEGTPVEFCIHHRQQGMVCDIGPDGKKNDIKNKKIQNVLYGKDTSDSRWPPVVKTRHLACKVPANSSRILPPSSPLAFRTLHFFDRISKAVANFQFPYTVQRENNRCTRGTRSSAQQGDKWHWHWSRCCISLVMVLYLIGRRQHRRQHRRQGLPADAAPSELGIKCLES